MKIKYIFFLIFNLYLHNIQAQQLSNYRICIDPGHGGHDPSNDRKISLAYGITFWESEGNLMTALNLDTLLINLGARVKLTRTANDDADDISLSSRSQIANDFGADYFHSIHSNGYNGEMNYSLVLYNGTDNVPTWTKAKEMADLMSPILYQVMRTTGYYSRGDVSALGFNLGVLKNTQMPSTLSEGAFHDYIPSGLRLKSLWFSKNYAWGIAKAFLRYFGQSGFAKGRIGGVVIDKANNMELNGTSVTATPGNISCKTDSNYNGFYALDLNPGNYHLVFEKKGYLTVDTSIEVTANDYSRFDVQLNYFNNGIPRADFYIKGLPANSNSDITFIAKNSLDSDGQIVDYSWNFGDSITAKGDSVVHQYKSDGNYKVQLVVTDNDNKKDTLEKQIEVMTEIPQAPVFLYVKVVSPNTVNLKWTSVQGASYRIYSTTNDDLSNFSLLVSDSVLTEGITEYTLSNFAPNAKGYNFKITAVNSAGESPESDIYSINIPANANAPKLLIIDGFDRISSWQNQTHAFANTYMKAWRENGDFAISCAANEMMTNGNIDLNNYDEVIIFLGDESTVDETLSSSEQEVVKKYLEQGGNLLITGSEIAWDLDKKGDTNDKNFFHNYLKANFSADGIIDNNPATGISETDFDGITLNFGQVYTEDYPDEISPIAPAEKILTYKNGATAALAYNGFFGQSKDTATLIYVAFPLETVANSEQLSLFATKAIQYFDRQGVTSVEALEDLGLKIYPQPAKDYIKVELYSKDHTPVKVEIYSLSGQKIWQKTYFNKQIELDVSTLKTGVYIIKIETQNTLYTTQIIKK